MPDAKPLRSVLAAFCLAALPASASAETDLGGAVLSGEIEAGGPKVSGDTDAAKFDEYRDVRQWIGRGHLLFEDVDRRHYLDLDFRDVGQLDEFYGIEGGRYGLWSLWGSYSELPHNYAYDVLTPYRGISSGVETLPFARPPANLAGAVQTFAAPEDVGFHTLTAEGGGRVSPFEGIDFEAGYRLIHKRGTIFRGGLGSFFNFADFIQPLDEKIHEFTADAEMRGDVWAANLNYTGNVYDNELHDDSITIDSFLTGTDMVGQASRWRMAAAPDNQAHNFTAAGSYLPELSFPLRVTGTFGYGIRTQDEDFLPATVNSTLLGNPSIVPSRDSLDGRIHTLLGDVRLTARPLPQLNVDLHYRIYDYDNETDTVGLLATVTTDRSIVDAVPGEFDRISVAPEYTRQEASLQGSYDLAEMATLGFGWQWEQWDRSSSRQVARTEEQGPTFRLDLRPAPWATLRASYEFTTRRRSGYEPYSYLYLTFNPNLLVDPEAEVFPEMRRFPQVDRRRQQLDFLAMLAPCETVDVSLTAGMDVSTYDGSDFGLIDDEWWSAGIDVGWHPNERLDVSAYYTFDQGLAEQNSRERPVVAGMVVDDPLNDWNTRTRERGYNVGLSLGAELFPGVLDFDLGFDFQRGSVQTHSGGPDVGAENWPTTKNDLYLLATALTWHVHEHVDLKALYRFERYIQRDFQRDDNPLTIGNDILISTDPGDYNANIYGLTITYEF